MLLVGGGILYAYLLLYLVYDGGGDGAEASRAQFRNLESESTLLLPVLLVRPQRLHT